MDELKNQASKIKREQEKQLDEMIKISVEQKSANEIINMHKKEKRTSRHRTISTGRNIVLQNY